MPSLRACEEAKFQSSHVNVGCELTMLCACVIFQLLCIIVNQFISTNVAFNALFSSVVIVLSLPLK